MPCAAYSCVHPDYRSNAALPLRPPSALPANQIPAGHDATAPYGAAESLPRSFQSLQGLSRLGPRLSALLSDPHLACEPTANAGANWQLPVPRLLLPSA